MVSKSLWLSSLNCMLCISGNPVYQLLRHTPFWNLLYTGSSPLLVEHLPYYRVLSSNIFNIGWISESWNYLEAPWKVPCWNHHRYYSVLKLLLLDWMGSYSGGQILATPRSCGRGEGEMIKRSPSNLNSKILAYSTT